MGRINYVLSVEDNEEMKEYRKWLHGQRKNRYYQLNVLK